MKSANDADQYTKGFAEELVDRMVEGMRGYYLLPKKPVSSAFSCEGETAATESSRTRLRKQSKYRHIRSNYGIPFIYHLSFYVTY